MNFRDDDAAAWNYVGRITRVPGRGGDAKVVLEVQVRLAQPVVIRETRSHQGFDCQAGQAEAAVDEMGPVLDLLSLRSVFILPTVHAGHRRTRAPSRLSSARPPAAQTTAGVSLARDTGADFSPGPAVPPGPPPPAYRPFGDPQVPGNLVGRVAARRTAELPAAAAARAAAAGRGCTRRSPPPPPGLFM